MSVSLPPDFLVFRYPHSVLEVAGNAVRTTDVVFWTGRHVAGGEIRRLVASLYRDATAPDRLLLLAPEDCQDRVHGILADDELQSFVADTTRAVAPPPMQAVLFDAAGALQGGTGGPSGETRVALVRVGLRHLFATGGGMLDPLDLYHFEKPSGVHSDRFIRTANVLRRGVDTDFVAFALLQYWPGGGVRHLYTDTASINSLAYAAAALRQRLAPGQDAPVIDSFGGYEGIDKFAPRARVVRVGLCPHSREPQRPGLM